MDVCVDLIRICNACKFAAENHSLCIVSQFFFYYFNRGTEFVSGLLQATRFDGFVIVGSRVVRPREGDTRSTSERTISQQLRQSKQLPPKTSPFLHIIRIKISLQYIKLVLIQDWNLFTLGVLYLLKTASDIS